MSLSGVWQVGTEAGAVGRVSSLQSPDWASPDHLILQL